jgi:hypothetical protein
MPVYTEYGASLRGNQDVERVTTGP